MPATRRLHATCVSLDGRAVLITGASGSGKSGLGLQLMALGCDLVADDQTDLAVENGEIFARCPATITGLIEARGVGLLAAASVPQSQVVLVVDLDKKEADRLPIARKITLLGHQIAMIYGADVPHFAAAVRQILVAGWSDR